MRVAVLTTVLPRGKRLGGDICTQAFVDVLRAEHPDLRVLGYDRPGDGPPPVAWETVIEARPIETAQASARTTTTWMLAALARRRPYSVQKYVSREYARAVAALDDVDLFVIDHAQAGWLVPRLGDRPFVYLAHNVEAEVYATQAAAARGRLGRWRYGREARLIAALERDLAGRATAVWTLTDGDAAELGGTVFAVPPAAIPPVAAAEPAFDVGLLGTWSWEANGVGLRWFVEEVVPRLPPGLDVRVAGLGGEAIAGPRAVGRVDDAVAFLRSARVVAIPTQAGGGVQIKSIDAAAAGVRVVSTPRGMRGVGDVPGHVVVADGADAFAAALAEAVATPPTGREGADAHAWATARAQAFGAAVSSGLSTAWSAATAPPRS